MTPQEQEKLQQFLNQMRQAQGVQRDPEADALINAAVSRQPDAAYLLVQRTLLQEQALEAARVRIAELEQQAQAPKPATSFLGGADDWGNSARSRQASNMPAMAAPSAPLQQQGYAQPEPAQRQGALSRFGMGGGGGGGSFLGTMAATAAGVAGGAFLFQGIGNLMGGNHGADAAKQGLASDTSGAGAASAAPASDNSLAQEAGLNDVSNTPAQEYGALDDTAALDDSAGMDDFGGDDSMI
ncbi:DUF2076 domain-containing protein [Noviherbaspirillum suwonense]|jgi:hypothetical protein|uniref:ABC transporter substrate-binding protein n=1 Tax=Noviherbaspirillum suwonense TaxID=1224511 RepID=A0ABY1PXJ3_9BURK|nr:DUF2076 domain-containing protein [Noviherbaspirillum suwonense]SMP49782.1 hypothetical protein SAMN06295970_102316 [Noviherbaspirillum suwonense]